MKKIAIRYLRQGLINVEVDEKTFNDKDLLLEFCNEYLRGLSDKEIINGMSDFENPEVEGYFDESVGVSAVEDAADDYELIISTGEWEAFIDRSSTLCYENKRFGDFFEHFELTPDDVTSLIINGTNEDWEKMFKRN